MIHRQNQAARIACAGCGQKNPPQSNYCPNCGGKLK
jgi:rRNA maturation endonuclease Nob1